MITGGSLEALGAGAPAQWRDDFCPASALVGAGFEPSVPRDTTKISRPAYVACACSRPTEIRRRERDPRPRGRRAPYAGPMVRIPFPPAESHTNPIIPTASHDTRVREGWRGRCNCGSRFATSRSRKAGPIPQPVARLNAPAAVGVAARNRRFESIPLQQRVNKLSVPDSGRHQQVHCAPATTETRANPTI
jgi:hypothetical protein